MSNKGASTMIVKTFKVKGKTDDVTTCDLCGREELSGTIVLEILDADGNSTGDVVYYGSSCGARAAGWTQKEFKARVREYEDTVREWLRAQSSWESNRYCTARDAWMITNYGTSDIYSIKVDGKRPGYALVQAFDAAIDRGEVTL